MSIVMHKTSKKTFKHITSIEISETWNIFIPEGLHFKKFMRKMGVSIIGGNQCFVDIVCVNNWVGVATSRTLFHVQSLEKKLTDSQIIIELDRACDITLSQFLELLKIHGRNRQSCGLHTDGVPNVIYIWPPKVSVYSGRLCAVSFSYTGGKCGGWVLNAVPMSSPTNVRNKGVNVISRCFAQDAFPV